MQSATRETGRSAGSGTLIAPFLSLWRHRELYRRVLVRDIQASFRGSALGTAWVVLIPLVMVAVYTFVFGAVLKSSWSTSTSSPYQVPLIFFSGLMVFGFFMEVVMRAPNYIRDNKTYVTKIIFPIDILCWVLVGTALFKFCVNLTLLLLFLAIFGGGLSWETLLLPLLMLPFILLIVGAAWILAAIGAFIRDLSHALQALGPIIMFISPVFYSVAQVPEPFRPLYFLNPLTFMLESARDLLFFERVFSFQAYLVFAVAACSIFVLGYMFFQKVRPGFADVV